MMIDEPAAWNLIPATKRDSVMIAAKALCRSRDADEEDDVSGCGNCNTREGGSCVAFGIYGQMAIDVVEALDRAKLMRGGNG